MFGIGGSKSKSKQEAESQETSGSQAISGSVSRDRASSSASSEQGLAFQNLFGDFYRGAAATASGISGKPVKNAADMLFSGGKDFLKDLQGGQAEDYLSARVSGESPVLGEQIAGLGADLGEFFRNELNPAITSQAVGGGTLGGGRQGVAQGLAVGQVAKAFSQGSTALRAADVSARDAAARDLGAGRREAASIGLGGLEGLLDIRQTGNMADLAPAAALAGILGGPTTLTQSQSGSESSADAVAKSVSESFSQGTSSSKGKSKSSSFSLGF